MKKILIIGASILQLPAIMKAKEMGLYVGVIDYNPEAVGVPYADEFFCVSTIDIPGILDVAKIFQPEGIFTLATDMPMRSIAAVCEKYHLPGISMETAIKATDKAKMIQAFELYQVDHPWYYVVNSVEELESVRSSLSFPCICKPIDNSGSRGVMLIQSSDELEQAFVYSSGNGRSGAVIIEEYLTGQEVSVEIVVIDGEPHVLQVTDKLTTGAPHFVELGHSQPSALSKGDLAKIHALAISAVKAIGIEVGASHVEIMNTANGPKIIELGARMGGDCITTHLVPLSTGVDMLQACIRLACGEEADVEAKYQKGSAIRYVEKSGGVIAGIKGVESAMAIPGIKQISIVKEIGDRVQNISSSGDRIGFVIAQGESVSDAIDAAENALSQIEISIN